MLERASKPDIDWIAEYSPSIDSTLVASHRPASNMTEQKGTERTEQKEEEPLTDYEKKLADFFDSIPEQQLVLWERAYPSIDIPQCILEARAYTFSNTHKSYKNLNRFVNGWLSRSNKEAKPNSEIFDALKAEGTWE